MEKYVPKGQPRSQPASEILSACINRLDNTDIASSALRRAMIEVAGERDLGSQETAHMPLGKPLYSCTYSFLCVSLDGSRFRTADEDNEKQGDQALDPSVLDHYATRANWQENNAEIFHLNLLQFASAYYVTKGELKHHNQEELIIRTFPIFSPNPSG